MQIFSTTIGLFEKIYEIRLFLAADKRQRMQANGRKILDKDTRDHRLSLAFTKDEGCKSFKNRPALKAGFRFEDLK